MKPWMAKALSRSMKKAPGAGPWREQRISHVGHGIGLTQARGERRQPLPSRFPCVRVFYCGRLWK